MFFYVIQLLFYAEMHAKKTVGPERPIVWLTLTIKNEETVTEVYRCIFHTMEITCCVRMVKQSSSSTTCGFNLSTSIAAWIKNPFQRTSKHNHSYNYLNCSFFH